MTVCWWGGLEGDGHSCVLKAHMCIVKTRVNEYNLECLSGFKMGFGQDFSFGDQFQLSVQVHFLVRTHWKTPRVIRFTSSSRNPVNHLLVYERIFSIQNQHQQVYF